MANRFSAPYFGAAYYPEAWAEEEMDKEIPLMLQAGMNAMRMGEFSWSTIWPQEDKFDFSRLDAAVQKLEKAGIASILCTPSATPPAWLTKKYPDMLSVNQAGLAVQHGGRRHCCSRNPHYISYSLKIAEELAKHFGKNSAAIGWQLDNEIYVQNGLGCFCPHCVSGFSGFLKEKYETIENLNDKWCTALWSQRYDDFSQIPAPQNAWHHPQLLTDWTLYQVQGHIDFLARQAAVIRKYSSAPIGTDLMPTALIDFEKIASFCDVLQFNHYNEVENTRETAFWFAYLRGQKKPFWNTETATNWNGSTECFMGIKPEGWCRANSLMPFLYGGDANLYWLWRAHRAGHELMHGSVISSVGKPLYNFGEVAQTGADLRAAASFLQNSSPAPARVALHFSGLTWAMRMFQNVVAKRSYFTDVLPIFNALTENGVDADVIGPRRRFKRV